ncbi:hypothetical protein WDU94_011290 [Cyamophila willieti]
MALKTALSFGSPSNSKAGPPTTSGGGLNLSSVLLQGAQGISVSCECKLSPHTVTTSCPDITLIRDSCPVTF